MSTVLGPYFGVVLHLGTVAKRGGSSKSVPLRLEWMARNVGEFRSETVAKQYIVHLKAFQWWSVDRCIRGSTREDTASQVLE